MCAYRIQHIAESQAGRRGDRNRISDAQIIKFIHIRHKFVKVIHFVHSQDHRFSRTAEHVCHFRIRILQALTNVSDENDDIRRIDRDLRLLPHLGQNNIPALRFDPSGIDQCKFPIQP